MARTTDAVARVNRRDRSMADNVLWVAGREPQAKLFLWAHNARVSRRPNAMGPRLGPSIGTWPSPS